MYSVDVLNDIMNIDKIVKSTKNELIFLHNRVVTLLKLYKNDKTKVLKIRTLLKTREIVLNFYNSEVVNHVLGELSPEYRVKKLAYIRKFIRKVLKEIEE